MRLIEFLCAMAPSETLIQRNGSGAWFCRFGLCGGLAMKIEEIKHSDDCPLKNIVKQTEVA